MAEGKVEEDDSKGEQTADEDMYADDADMAGVTVDMDSRTRITVRNLRIRFGCPVMIARVLKCFTFD